jgi:hypothetical protein
VGKISGKYRGQQFNHGVSDQLPDPSSVAADESAFPSGTASVDLGK